MKYGDYAKTGNALEEAFDTLTKRGVRITGLAIPWFTAESWPKLLAVATDRWNLPDTFEEFEGNAGKRFADLGAQGHPCEKVLIDVDQLAAWCSDQCIPLDGKARAAFAGYELARRDAIAGNA
jgi:hypothetical protein